MKTTKLYQTDVYLKEWHARITAAIPADDGSGMLITLDKTAFFPEGGGQSCDTGLIENFTVTDVQEQDGEIYHKIPCTADADAENHLSRISESLLPGTSVRCSINWKRRFDNMQRHCGEHILSGVFYSLFGGVNRGFHMGHDYMTIDISLEEDPNIKEITPNDASIAEIKANKIIWSDVPVTVMRFDSREEAEKMPLRKALALSEDISIVSVGSVENAADCVACCGTHPSSSGQVGLIKIYKVENYKGMFRIYFEAGQRAMNDYRRKHDMLISLSEQYSSSVEDFPKKLKAKEEKLAAVKNELFHIKKAFIENECQKLDAVLIDNPQKVIIYRLDMLSTDDAFNMAKRYMGKSSTLIMLYSAPDTSYILASDGTADCGALVKEYASFYGGKGGGNKVSARAIFSGENDAELFADLISKHLK